MQLKLKNTSRVAIITGLILLVPLILQFTIGTGVDNQGFNWMLHDFVAMGVLIFSTGLLIDFAWRNMGTYKVIGILTILFIFVWLWAELAVGVFTNWGS